MKRSDLVLVTLGCVLVAIQASAQRSGERSSIGRETAIPHHLQDGDEFTRPLLALIEFGKQLFSANWTDQDGAGRPLANGTGGRLANPADPLKGSRAFNRVSGPDANSCQGCHNAPYGITGGGGDFVTSVFQMAQRFDFVTFDRAGNKATRNATDANGRSVSLQTVGNARATPGLFGAGYLEMLARQMTADLQSIRDSLRPGESKQLATKGVSFGVLKRRADRTFDTSLVEGLPQPSLTTDAGKPSLIIRPWQQGGHAVSLREVTNTAYNQHLGMQTTERFGVNKDPDGDGVVNEMTRADITAVMAFEATMPVPGRLIPNDAPTERAVLMGERLFDEIGCAACHVPSLVLDRRGWFYSEPGPYNPSGNLRQRDARTFEIDLTDAVLPAPRLVPSPLEPDIVRVAPYTDFKLHDITDPNDAGAAEPLDINAPADSPLFVAGNRKFLTRRLWGAANDPPYFHHGLFTTLRDAVEAHAGEALEQRRSFERLSKDGQDAVIEFLKSLQVLPPGTKHLIVDERYQPRLWPPAGASTR